MRVNSEMDIESIERERGGGAVFNGSSNLQY